MLRLFAVTLLSAVCFSARADLVNFVEGADLPDLLPGIEETFVLDTAGVNQWTGTIWGYEIPSGASDSDEFIVDLAPGIVITDFDLVTSNVSSSGFANFAQKASLLDAETFVQAYSETQDVLPVSPEFNVIDNLPVDMGAFIVQSAPSAAFCSPGPCSATWTWTISITTANAPVWDESSDGDLGNGLGLLTNLGTLDAGAWDILGDLDDAGSFAGPDPIDTVEFTTTGSWTFDVSSLNPGTATGQHFFLYDASNQNLEALFVTTPTTNIFGTYPAGTYRLSSTPLNNIGTLSYTHSINVESSPDAGLVSYWSFDDGTATDQAGTNHGVLVGGVSATGGGVDMAPIPGNSDALRFDGNQSAVRVRNDSTLDFAATDGFTLSMWFKRESDRPIYHLLGKRDGCSLLINYQLARDFGLLHFNWPRVDADVDAGLDEWVHIASTYDGSDPATARIYVGGIQRGTVSPLVLGPVVNADLQIGSSGNCPDDQRFQGVIDEVRIYDRALDAPEVAALAGLVQNEAPVADAGPDQSARAGVNVFLDGTASFDDDTPTAELTASWRILTAPPGSTASLLGAESLTPEIMIDVSGTYEIELVVTDAANLASAPDTMMISNDNLAPTANAGDDELTFIGSLVTLDGSASIDPEGDIIIYDWLVSTPAGSVLELNGVAPGFAVLEEGEYIVELTVSDFLGPNPEKDVATITVASTEDFAQTSIMEADNLITDLDDSEVTTAGNQNALTKFFVQAVRSIQKGNIADAIAKLENALLRTDGCVERGAPDDGSGPGERDWITSCDAQTEAYNEIGMALDALRAN